MRALALHLCLPVVLLGLSIGAANGETPLDELRWESRVLIVFAPDEHDKRLDALEASLVNAECERLDRDLILGKIVRTGKSQIGERQIDVDAAQSLREQFNPEDADFLVLLIGKDGRVKETYGYAPKLEQVFRLIDGMPMRRVEIQTHARPCNGESS